jgi:hypothetical protein
MSTPIVVIEETPPPVVVINPPPPAPIVFISPPGPPGPAGGGIAAVAYTLTAVGSWTHTHAFPYPPEVQLVLAAGERVYADVEYPDSTHVALVFPTPFTGTVILR